MGNIGLSAILTIFFVGLGTVVFSQPHPRGDVGHRHGGTTLFLAQVEAGRVVPARTSSATATGAFIAG
jgi:hypothetical protein